MRGLPLSVMLVTLALAGCKAAGPDVPTPDVGKPVDVTADQCGASALQYLVGQPRSVLKTMKFGTQTRIIGPNDAVTMDFSPGRLNIVYGPDQKIVTVACN